MKVGDFLKLLQGVKACGKGWQARCPAHDDETASLSVAQGDDGRILIHCFAGCTIDEVCTTMGIKTKDLFPKKLTVFEGGKAKAKTKIIATYDYHDKSGAVVFRVRRTADKRFFQQRPNGRGGWLNGRGKVAPVLYRLPEVVRAAERAETVFIPEGEKDCDNLAALGLVSTTNAGGAGKWRDEYSSFLEGARAVILPDKDGPGRKHAEQVAQNLHDVAESVKVLELPGLPEKGDVTDWLDGGGTAEELKRLAAAAPEWRPDPKRAEEKPTPSTAFIQNLTDRGNGWRLAAAADGNFRFLVERQKWLHWTGKRWEIDQAGAIMQLAKQTAINIYDEIKPAGDEKQRAAIASHALRSESEARLRAMIALAKSEPNIPITATELDKNPWLLNCENGTINLKTGKLQPHNRADFITKMAPAKYDPAARSEAFEAFVARILPAPDVRRFAQKAAGYSASGDTSLEKLFFAYGPAATGKSTLTTAILKALGDYAATADFESFLQRTHATGAPRNDIARLAGRRFVASVEVQDGKRLAEGLINQLTGGDTVTARYLYGEHFEFRPQFTLWLAANNRPTVSGPESAIWRRMVQIPFLEEIPPEERDPALKARLQNEERDAVLAWLVRGCLLWQKEGLQEPQAVQELTAEYREESDPLRDFIDDCCVISAGSQAGNAGLWQAYQNWCKDNSIRYPLGRKRFSQALLARGLDQYRSANERFWTGVGLVSERK